MLLPENVFLTLHASRRVNEALRILDTGTRAYQPENATPRPTSEPPQPHVAESGMLGVILRAFRESFRLRGFDSMPWLP